MIFEVFSVGVIVNGTPSIVHSMATLGIGEYMGMPFMQRNARKMEKRGKMNE
jgi:hypothetical protein